ncbi:PP2C family protein-serine/threonine phosphatase [Nocardioides sp. Kera G14]|uniref:PP2C family protein-serine/threonine phosphatase n=1 Tax=Nocardioides sp. Kera G14 TaxID=2884264 RepID=UPI001D11535F|nr:SpoIIE family protein phosphatase [Nocardioides sp. Kera G14]UDY22850.1 SpoIIE family protein phosphatase [Nocardioides sp. Kera G14]
MWIEEEPFVLLIEDDPGDALLVEELVADCRPSMSLAWARSMADAEKAVASRRPDCILLDLHLSDSSGMGALARIQVLAHGVPVVVLTGLAEESTGFAAVAAGAQDYLVKGRVDPESLGRAVRYATQRKQSELATVALRASELQARENARLERGLLPTPLLAEGSAMSVTSRYRPGRAQALLGGDFYDVVERPDGTIEALIGDVSGHGPDEAALGVALRIAWRTLILSGVEGVETLRQLEQILAAERAQEHIFATLTHVSLLADRRRVRVLRAGHPGLFVRTGRSVELIEVPGGPALGVLHDATWPVHELTLPEDGELLLVTDGLLEGRISDDNGERLGEEGLLTVARELEGADPEEFVDALIARTQELSEPYGGLDDDLAVVHLTWRDR